MPIGLKGGSLLHADSQPMTATFHRNRVHTSATGLDEAYIRKYIRRQMRMDRKVNP
jgi:hypothetical protein